MKTNILLTSIILVCLLFSCNQGHPLKQPYKLKCEYKENPLGLDVVKPRLSWLFNDTSRGAVQTAYQVLVASDPVLLKKDIGDIWNSEKIASDRSVWVDYMGAALQSGTRYFWKVRTWDRDDLPSSWSEVAWWETGLLNPGEWKAKWIGMDLIVEDKALANYGSWISAPLPVAAGKDIFFRKTFVIPEGKTPRRAFLNILGTQRARFSFNGEKAIDLDFQGSISTIPIQEKLKTGNNLISLITKNKRSEEVSVIFYMEIIYSDGTTQWICSDENTRVSQKIAAGWDQPGFNDSSWEPPRIIAPFGKGEYGWIKNAGPAPRSTLIRKSFMANKKIRSARAYVTGLGNYELYINGSRIGKDLLTPGWTDYNKRIQYQVYDITENLVRGENAAGMFLGNMWWSSGLGWRGCERYNNGPVMGLCQIRIDYADGTTDLVVTDESWKSHLSPLIENTIYHGEVYDARQEIPGWASPGLVDSTWQSVKTFSEYDHLIKSAEPGPPIRVMNEIMPVSVSQVKPGIYVFDMGTNMVGFARLHVSGDPGTQVILRFAELLHDDGTVAQENLRLAKATDYYTLKGGSPETWQPRFTYHGFRYVQMEGFPGVPDSTSLIGLQIYSSAPMIGQFSCSNELINQIYKNIINGQRSNMHSVPTDCPQRDERLGWTGDAQMFSPTASYNMNMDGFFAKWLHDMTDSQTKDGWINDVNPAIVVSGPGKPAWADAITVVPWVVHEFYADTRIISDNYAGMKAWVDYMIKESKNGLYIFDQNGWGGYGDWISVVPSPAQPVSAAYYYYSTHLLGQMAALTGNEKDATKYNELAKEIAETFNKKYLDRKTSDYLSATQTANLLPLAFGIVPEELRQKVADNIAADVIAKQKHPSTGFLGTGYILPMLSNYGYHELAYEVACQTSYPSWGYMVEKGATSIWELWNSDTEPPDQMNSRNHFALGSVGEWFYACLAGIRPSADEPGFKQVIIAPGPAGDLTWAKGSLETIYGTVISDWKLDGQNLILDILIPANTHATVYVPTMGITNPTLTMDGTVLYAAGKAASELPEGIELSEVGKVRMTLHIPAGKYHIVIRK